MVEKNRRPQREMSLFISPTALKTVIIAQQGDLDKIFAGFSRMRAISYVASPDLLLDFFESRGYTEVEIIVGENLSGHYKHTLEQKGIEITERLADLVERGKLRVYVPDRTIHTKLYFLECVDFIRVIQTSANLTDTAQKARKQINYAWYLDLPHDDATLNQLIKDYEMHRKGCSLFMDDLRELIGLNQETERRQIIEAWLRGNVQEYQDIEVKQLFHELSNSLIDATSPGEQTVAVLRLPDSSEARKKFERILTPLKPVLTPDNQLQLSSLAYIRYVFETKRVPLLLLDSRKNELLLGLEFPMLKLTDSLPEPDLVNRALEQLEAYLQTVDLGQSVDHRAVKTNMYEAILYILFAPFAHEYMKLKRLHYGLFDTRGPRFLYIYGPSQNGKSTFLRFALKLLTGRAIEPLSRDDFTKTRIINASMTGTLFPLVFDDVDPTYSGLGDIFKSYWERWWNEQYPTPQLIITSNVPRLQEWAKSRVIRIDFDVHFAPSPDGRATLARLFSQENLIFKWFSFLYIQELNKKELPGDDELYLSRKVMKKLYEYAGRKLPEFFPEQPIEKLYDPGRRDWRDIVYELHKAEISSDKNRTLVTFTRDMQSWEVNYFQSSLPQTIKSKRKGNTLIIENPAEFQKWLGQPQPQGLFSRLFRKNH